MTRAAADQIELGTMLQLYTQYDSDSRSQLPSMFDLKAKMGDLNVILTTKVYPHVKFCKGKGKSPSFPGFDKPDLRDGSRSPLAFAVLDGMGLWSAGNSLLLRTSWWICIREAVRAGITRNRNSTSNNIKVALKKNLKAERASTTLNPCNESGPFRGYSSWSLYYRSGMGDLAELAKSRSLENLRSEGNSKAFLAFAHFILVETRPAKAWKDVQRSKKVSEFFTVHDEALALVLLENGIAHWESLMQDEENGVEIPDGRKRKHCETLYSSNKGKGKGWTPAGKARFKEFVGIITKQRGEVFSTSLEEALMSDYEEVYNGGRSIESVDAPYAVVEIDDFDEDEASGLKVSAI